jgi:hypothetical protein
MNGECAVTREVFGEEIESRGHFREVSVTSENSAYTHFRLARTPRILLQRCQRMRARVGAPSVRCAVGPTGLDSAQRYLHFFLFLFQWSFRNM